MYDLINSQFKTVISFTPHIPADHVNKKMKYILPVFSVYTCICGIKINMYILYQYVFVNIFFLFFLFIMLSYISSFYLNFEVNHTKSVQTSMVRKMA